MSTTTMLLNEQITKEFYNSNLYLCMASHLDNLGLEGFAKEYAKHSDEERGHGQKIRQHLVDRGFEISIGPVEACPSFAGKSPLAIAQLTLQAEKQTTASLYEIANAASAEADHTSYSFIQWFIDEQVEEENSADKLVRLLTINEDYATILLDQEWLED